VRRWECSEQAVWNDSFTPYRGVCMIRSMPRRVRAKEEKHTLPTELPNPFTTAEALSFGIPRVTLHRLVNRGEISPIARGLYERRSGMAFDFDLVEIAAKIPIATICLTSALAEHGLSDEIPTKIDIAIPRGTWAPRTKASVNWHRFDLGTFNQGRNTLAIPGTSMSIGIYSPERTLADLARHPKKDQPELAEGIRRWLRRSGNNPAKLLKVARELPGAGIQIQRILEILA
jgi:predicted transcriptional regulator of viral defense system